MIFVSPRWVRRERRRCSIRAPVATKRTHGTTNASGPHVRSPLPLATLVAWLAACSSKDPPQTFAAPSASSGAPAGTTSIHVPEKLESIETGQLDPSGKPQRIACVTCHTVRTPEKLPESPGELVRFHQGLVFKHGTLRCASCHLVGPQDSLRLADGSKIPNRDAMLLCGQCHGPQLRDYQHGAHGGMNGYWDLGKGNRVRNHCVDCHDPHFPRFLPTNPVLRPADRLLPPPIEKPAQPPFPKLGEAHP